MAYQTVVHIFDVCHGIQIILRTLKPKLKTVQLTKSPNIVDKAVRQIIKRELRGTFAGHGYCFKWFNLKTTYGIQVKETKKIQLEHSLEDLGILNEGFAMVQTILGIRWS